MKLKYTPEFHDTLTRQVLRVHDADVLSSDHDPDWQSECLNDLCPPNIVQNEEAVSQVA